jgi:hypothetical protein
MGLGRWSSSTFTYIDLCRCLDHTSQQDDDDDQQVGQHHHDDDLEEEEEYERRVPAHPQGRVGAANRQEDQREDRDRRDDNQNVVRQRPDTRRQDNEHVNAELPRHRRTYSGSRSGAPAASTASRNTRTPRSERVDDEDEVESPPPRAYVPLKRLRKAS